MSFANVGGIDRWARIVIGLAVVSLYFWGPQSPWALLGLVPLITGIAGYCPAYSLFGLSSCPIARGGKDAKAA